MNFNPNAFNGLTACEQYTLSQLSWALSITSQALRMPTEQRDQFLETQWRANPKHKAILDCFTIQMMTTQLELNKEVH